MRDIAFPREIDRENAAHRLLATRARSLRGSIDQTRVEISDGWDSYAQCFEFNHRNIYLGLDNVVPKC